MNFTLQSKKIFRPTDYGKALSRIAGEILTPGLVKHQNRLKDQIAAKQEKINELRAFIAAPSNVKIKGNLS